MSSISWANINGGDWATTSNWSGGAVPGSSDIVTLGGLSSPYTVTLFAGETDAASTLTISAANAALSLQGTASLAITGAITNSGIFDVDAFSLDGGGTLTAGGLLTNNSGGQVQVGNSFLSTNTSATFKGLTNSAGANFSAFGASSSLKTTVTMTGAVTNAGTFSMNAFSTFAGGSNNFTQTAGSSTIRGGFAASAVVVSGGSFTINDAGTTFSAASLTVSSGGKVTVSSGSTIGLTSALVVSSGGSATIAGTLTPVGGTAATVANGGTLILNPTFGPSTGKFTGGGSATLQLAGTGAGTLNNSGGTTLTGFNTLTVAAGASWTVNWLTTALPGTTMTGNNSTTGSVLSLFNTSAAAPNLSGVTKFGTIKLGTGSNTVTVPAVTLAGGAVTISGGSGGNTITAAGDGTAAAGKTLTYVTGGGTDSFTGGNENDVVSAGFAAVVSGTADTLTGGSATNTLTLTTSGSGTLSNRVTNFNTINLFGTGSNSSSTATDSVTLVDATLGRASITVNGGAKTNDTLIINDASFASFMGSLNGTTKALTVSSLPTASLLVGDIISGVGVLAGNKITAFVTGTGGLGVYAVSGAQTIAIPETMTASLLTGKTLTFNAGAGVDTFTGGAENDVVRVTAAAVSTDTLNGGLGANTLTLTTATTSGGTTNLGGVSNFTTINLGGATANKLTVTAATLTGPVTINDTNAGTTLGAGTASGGQLTFNAGTGVDVFTGGTEADVVKVSAAAVNQSGESMNGAGGSNTLNLSTAGTFSLANVKNFGTINLAGGSNNVTLTDNTLNGNVKLLGGSSNTISAASTTSASIGKTLTYAATAGRDVFSGGFENDTVSVGAVALGLAGEALTGGTGTNTLNMTTAGSFNLANTHNFGTVNLANGNNTVTATLTTGEAVIGAASANVDALNVQNTGTVDLTKVNLIDTINLGAAAAAGRAVSIGTTTLSATTLALPVTLNEAGTMANTITSTAASGFLTYNATIAGDRFTGGSEADTVKVSLANLATDTLNGGSTNGSNDTLSVTTAGTLTLGSPGATGTLSNFGTISIAAGTIVIVNDLSIGGGTLTIKDGANGNNRINASTKPDAGVQLTYIAGTGADTFTGGLEKDIVKVGAGLSADLLTGGSNAGNTLMLTAAGSFTLGGVSKFSTINLNPTGGDTVTLTSNTLSGGAVTVVDGTSGNNVVKVTGVSGEAVQYTVGAASSDTFTGGAENDVVTATLGSGTTLTVKLGSGTDTVTASGPHGTVIVHAGTGADTLTGGASLNEFYAGGNTTMTGNSAATDEYLFAATSQLGAGNTITNFGFSFDELVFSNGAFGLGFTGATVNPQNWSVESGARTLATDFTSNANGLFGAATSTTRLLFDTANGALFYSSNGTDAAKHEVGVLMNGGSPITNAATVSSHLFFTT